MTEQLSQFDRRLLDRLQHSVPLVARPYAQLAEELGASEAEVVARVNELSPPGGVIREIAGIFHGTALGYDSTLAAAQIAPEKLDAAGELAATHPGVSHCYGRAGEMNLWFTLVTPPDSQLGLEGTVKLLAKLSGAKRFVSLPVVKRYKLDVRFDLSGEAAKPPERTAAHAVAAPAKLTEAQIRAVRALQEPLPATPAPFDELSRRARLRTEELLVHGADLLAAGLMRRYAAALRHRQTGATANLLVAWRVPEASVDAFGCLAAQAQAVSHCYLRQANPDWPYNFYTMIHGRSETEAAMVVERLALEFDFPRISLPTLREYKKEKVRYFSPEFARWEKSHA